ncbi:MAG: 2-oxoglutarate dehydrogenase E1 [Pseudomonadota bacterium]
MKTITLTVPWCYLLGPAKRFETRSWLTMHRGPIAIHAAKTIPDWVYQVCVQPEFFALLERLGLNPIDKLPRGAVIATADLVDIEPTSEELRRRLSPQELLVGNFNDGRFAWDIRNVRRLPEPIPARGQLGLWTWEPPAGFKI